MILFLFFPLLVSTPVSYAENDGVTDSTIYFMKRSAMQMPCAFWLMHFNSSLPSAAYVRQWIGSALIQIMAYRLFSTKPLSKPIVNWTFRNKLQWNFTQSTNIFLDENASEIYRLRSGGHFCPGGDELNQSSV